MLWDFSFQPAKMATVTRFAARIASHGNDDDN